MKDEMTYQDEACRPVDPTGHDAAGAGKMKEYADFLKTKQTAQADAGFEVAEEELNARLFPFQKYCVRRALQAGRFALFEDCGLGKTLQQLEWARRVSTHCRRPVLILAPLGVVGQTVAEGGKFGYEVKELGLTVFDQDLAPGIYITNYDNMDSIDADLFGGVVLDESSILKNFTGKTRTALIEDFRRTPYKLCCTATPSPNDTTELCNHAEFLGVMKRTEMLAMYFVHDGGSTSDWRLKGHAAQAFWDFVSTWAVMLSKPGDVGFSNEGYELPRLNVEEVYVETERRDNGMLFNDVAVSATGYHRELRDTMELRMRRVADIVNASDESWIVWVGHDEEGRRLRELVPDAVEVKGSDTKQYKKDRLLGFGRGEFRVLVTKLKIAQFGLNYQNCHNQIFASLDFSFEATYQGIRRSYRFGQRHEVNIYLVVTDTMQNVRRSFDEKQRSFATMQQAMRQAMNRNLRGDLRLLESSGRGEYRSARCLLRRGDCVRLMAGVPSESVGFSIFSPPFAELYTYSDKLEDMGNSKDYREFFTAFRFLVDELYRVLWGGRNVAVHCMDLPIQKGKEGYIGLRDFSGMILEAFTRAGFVYHSRVTIWKNPVTEMQRTKTLGLLHKQVKKDAAMCRVGIPDYLMVFRKPGGHDHPVHCDIPVDTWKKYASPVWMDIDYSDTLNASRGRESGDEKHICPLQLPTIERAVTLWSNPGDTVLTPFLGIGSEVYQSILLGRFGLGFELKESYFDEAVRNCRAAEQERAALRLF